MGLFVWYLEEDGRDETHVKHQTWMIVMNPTFYTSYPMVILLPTRCYGALI